MEKLESEWIPCGWRLLVLPEVVEEKTEGGIYLPSDVTEREGMAEVKAIVIDIAEFAWADQKIPTRWCEVGDTVKIAKFAGLIHKEGDKVYRFINDTDVVAVKKKR